MYKLLLHIVFIFSFIYSFSQSLEVGTYLGTSSYLGEIGGKHKNGRPLFLDLQLRKTQPALGLFYRYQSSHIYAFRTNLFYGVISGEDNLSAIDSRKYRNLSFKTNIFEVSTICQIELFELIHYLQGKDYHFRREVGNQIAGHKIHILFFAGLGFFHFNPKAFYNNTWNALQPLGTEGQGIDDNRKKYHRIQPVIPMGFEIAYPISEYNKIGFDFGLRKTFTDYLDDISTVYYDKQQIEDNYGPTAAALSDRSGEVTTTEEPWPYSTSGSVRGNPKNKDYYFFTTFTFAHKFYTTNHYSGHQKAKKNRRFHVRKSTPTRKNRGGHIKKTSFNKK